MTRRPISGWVSNVLLPIIKIHLDSAISAIDWVIAPDPNAPASPTTVDAWQRRAQWSMLGVFKNCPGKLLHQVVLLIGDPGRSQAGHLFALV